MRKEATRVKVQVDELRARMEAALIQHGAIAEHARIVADVLVEAELRGRPTHGLMRLPGILKVCDSGPSEEPVILEEDGPRVLVDGRDHLGYVVGFRMAEKAVEVAKREKTAVVACRNTRHCGMLGYYVSWMAERGVVGLAFAHCCPLMAPWGGAEPVLGTNPIAAAFPAEPHPILVDLGTSATTYGAAALARQEGRRIPAGTALDKAGNPTDDPAEVREGALLSFGEHKGYALAVMVQLLAGALTGAASVPETHRDYGILLIGFRPDAFTSDDAYAAGVRELWDRLKSARRRKGFDEILLPGERAYRERERRLREGVDVAEELWRGLESAP